jgi:hypothetical protein
LCMACGPVSRHGGHCPCSTGAGTERGGMLCRAVLGLGVMDVRAESVGWDVYGRALYLVGVVIYEYRLFDKVSYSIRYSTKYPTNTRTLLRTPYSTALSVCISLRRWIPTEPTHCGNWPWCQKVLSKCQTSIPQFVGKFYSACVRRCMSACVMGRCCLDGGRE